MFTGLLPRYTVCFLSTVITSRCSVISFTVLDLGTSTSIPDCKIGAVIMKMISSTRTTSMKGTMLISDSDDCVFPTSCGINSLPLSGFGAAHLRLCLRRERLLDLRRHLESKRIEPLRQIPNIPHEVVIENHRRNSGEK